ncbi:MAG TPA: glycosyltransferase 87 family protein [Candidatus Eisenbacteria bacterium]|nr:glycosyltransferase 87 family protein [Candidatus Eisenbacteria bacterium]
MSRPIQAGERRLPAPGLVGLAAIGGILLLVVAAKSWPVGGDEQAYWRAAQRLAAGMPLYDPSAAPNAPYVYWYPPPLAQLLAPLTPFLSPAAFTAAWVFLLLGCLWWLSGRDVLVALALIAFIPVALELRTRNVHLVLAVLIVLSLRRSWVFWVPAAALKIAPGLGAVYLLAAGRIREALAVGVLGLGVLGVSVALAPEPWREFLVTVGARAGTDGGAMVPIPFPIRFAVGAALAAFAGRVGGRRGEILLVVGLTVANPTLWVTALSMLVAIVPLLRTARPVPGFVARVPSPAGTQA